MLDTFVLLRAMESGAWWRLATCSFTHSCHAFTDMPGVGWCMSLSKISPITGGVRKSHCTLTCKNDHLMSTTNIATDAKAWLQQQSDGRLSTHSDECHKCHHTCLVNRLVGEVDRLKEINKDYARIVKASADEIKYLREQLEQGG